MAITLFSALPIEKQFLFERFQRKVEQDLRLRRSGHSGKIPADTRMFFSEFAFLQPILEAAPAFVAWVEACKAALEEPEPEIIALAEGTAIVLNDDETEDAAFLRWLRANPRFVFEHVTVARLGNITRVEKSPETMSRLKSEILYIKPDWRPAWQIAQEDFITWLSAYKNGETLPDTQASEPVAEEPEEPKRRGRPPGSFKKVLQEGAALAGIALPFLGGLK